MPELSPNVQPIDAQFGDSIQLTAFSADPPLDALSSGETVNLKLSWQTLINPRAAYTIFVHILDANGNIIAQEDSQPMNGIYPTNIWEAGERVVTTDQITLPTGALGDYSVEVGLYSWPTLERLPVVQNGVVTPSKTVILFSNVLPER